MTRCEVKRNLRSKNLTKNNFSRTSNGRTLSESRFFLRIRVKFTEKIKVYTTKCTYVPVFSGLDFYS